MKYFNRVSSLNELKLLHRRLAMLNHPDLGGSMETMKEINGEYELLKQRFKVQNQKFGLVAAGDLVVVNGSVSLVIQVFKDSFKARSGYTQRVAEFSKLDGVCLTNPKFVALKHKSIQRW